MLSYQRTRSSTQYLCHCSQPQFACLPVLLLEVAGVFAAASSDLMKNSSSICSNSRERNVKFRGLISFRNAFPIWQIPNGTFCRDTSNTFLNCAKIACAVSGLKYATFSSLSTGPTYVLNIKLNARGSVRRLPFSGL